MSAKGFKEGDLVAWKYGQGLIFGHVESVHDNGTVAVKPLKEGGGTVLRKPDNLLGEGDLSEHDIRIAKEHSGHMARREATSDSEKAQKMDI